MKKFFAFVFLVACIATSNYAQDYITTTNLNVRDTSNVQGHILTHIPSGAVVRSLGENNGWIKIHYRTVTGYISLKYVRSSLNTAEQSSPPYANPPQSSVHYYTNVDGNTVQAPTKYGSAPPGATAKCNDGTYSFSQHARGTCSHHGGVAQWLH